MFSFLHHLKCLQTIIYLEEDIKTALVWKELQPTGHKICEKWIFARPEDHHQTAKCFYVVISHLKIYSVSACQAAAGKISMILFHYSIKCLRVVNFSTTCHTTLDVINILQKVLYWTVINAHTIFEIGRYLKFSTQATYVRKHLIYQIFCQITSQKNVWVISLTWSHDVVLKWICTHRIT